MSRLPIAQTMSVDLTNDDNDNDNNMTTPTGPQSIQDIPPTDRSVPGVAADSTNTGGWMRRRSRKSNAAVTDLDGGDRSPSSLTPPPSGVVARHTGPVVLEPTIDIRSPAYDDEDVDRVRANNDGVDDDDDDGDDDRSEDKPKGDRRGIASNGHLRHDTLLSQIVNAVEDAMASAASHPEPETPNMCALTAAHRIARLDGMSERLAEAAIEHRRHRAQQPDGQFSKTRQRRARVSKANDFVHERFRIAHALAKHYNELFYPRGRRFVGRAEASTASQGASTATRGHHARMALFWLDTLVRFDRTFNVAGDLPAPTVERPLSARDMSSLHNDPTLVAASLADKFEPPDDRARQRKRPPPRPTAPVDFSGADHTGSSRRRQRRRLARPDGDGDNDGAARITDDDTDDSVGSGPDGVE
ncbi:hypothetical protein psal_cds_634 [Pandoravirus salinus]|uniref:Uncharacterized protein n=1 Tax=Pandoravirus salinus TaxID=1349410 RepID=S4VV97_9VIRU|nr:hypothetical protein psal_cds_634 [Pandoravirus salinus]AGO84524.1 hypothetical protein psal_cds_634 [Pandoravirus salinus]